MMNDSVREELQTKIGAGSIPPPVEKKEAVTTPAKMQFTPPPPAPKPQPARNITAELTRQKTSPTLVEFQTKNATLPDWRLQLQNAVRGRKANGVNENGSADGAGTAYQAQLVTSGANALKAEYVVKTETETEPKTDHKDPRVANALKRIADSRKHFLPEPNGKSPAAEKAAASRNYPFNVVSRTAESPTRPPEMRAKVNVPPKPRLVPTVSLKKKRYDTNKLPPVPMPLDEPISSIEMRVDLPINEPEIIETRQPEFLDAVEIVDESTAVEMTEPETDEIDDLAPFAMRFNAGLFDLIICVFATLILLSPIAFAGGNWFSGSGVLALLGTCSILMFLYLTVSVGLFGKTVGMRMFSLELVDADENEYPTFHQAAVSSSVYLLLLPLGGIGYLTMLFNDEQRALHDLLSGTIIVTEF